jgi:hypothetical protein
MIFKAPPQFGQCSMSMSIFPELTQYWNRFQIGTARALSVFRPDRLLEITAARRFSRASPVSMSQ